MGPRGRHNAGLGVFIQPAVGWIQVWVLTWGNAWNFRNGPNRQVENRVNQWMKDAGSGACKS
jgi:hypothetical protein